MSDFKLVHQMKSYLYTYSDFHYNHDRYCQLYRANPMLIMFNKAVSYYRRYDSKVATSLDILIENMVMEFVMHFLEMDGIIEEWTGPGKNSYEKLEEEYIKNNLEEYIDYFYSNGSFVIDEETRALYGGDAIYAHNNQLDYSDACELYEFVVTNMFRTYSLESIIKLKGKTPEEVVELMAPSDEYITKLMAFELKQTDMYTLMDVAVYFIEIAAMYVLINNSNNVLYNIIKDALGRNAQDSIPDKVFKNEKRRWVQC